MSTPIKPKPRPTTKGKTKGKHTMVNFRVESGLYDDIYYSAKRMGLGMSAWVRLLVIREIEATWAQPQAPRERSAQ